MSAKIEAPKAKKRGGWTYFFLILVLVIAALAAAEIAGWPFLANPLQQFLSNTLERRVVLNEARNQPSDSDPTIKPFRIRFVGGLRAQAPVLQIDAPSWSRSPYTVRAENIALALRYIDLWRMWRGRDEEKPLVVKKLQAQKLYAFLERPSKAQISWQFGEPKKDKKDSALPVFEVLEVREGKIEYQDAVLDAKAQIGFSLSEGKAVKKLTLPQNTETQEVAAGLHVVGKGSYRKLGLNFELSSEGILPWLAEDASNQAPLPVKLEVHANDIEAGKKKDRSSQSKLTFTGSARDALRLQQLQGKFVVSGPALAAIGDPLGVTLPTTPPFFMEGSLRRNQDTWEVNFPAARIGSSQLSGDFKYRADLATPELSGNLNAKILRITDLGPTVGSEEPIRERNRALPEKEFDLPSLRRMNADIKMNIARLDLATEALQPLEPFKTHIILKNGVLRLDALEGRTAQGHLTGWMQLDASDPERKRAVWQTALQWDDVHLEQWLKQKRNNAPPYISGVLKGSARLNGEGRSTAAILGSLQGSARTEIINGQISHLVMEGAGLDLAQALGVGIKGDNALPLACALGDFKVEQGLFKPRAMVLDTQDSTIWLDGQISLKDESMHLRTVVVPKDFSPLALRTPIEINGSFLQPKVSLQARPLVAKLGAATLLGLLNPLAAIIPLVDMPAKPQAQSPAEVDALQKATPGCRALSARSQQAMQKTARQNNVQ